MSNFTTEEIELAKVLHNAIPADHGIRIETIRLNQARAALKWCAEHPPAISDERREEIKKKVWSACHGMSLEDIDGALVAVNVIPRRREKSIGEIVRDIVLKSDPSLAAGKIDELLGKLVELAKAAQVPERDAYDQYYDWHDRIKAKAEDALAPIEALKAVQKKE